MFPLALVSAPRSDRLPYGTDCLPKHLSAWVSMSRQRCNLIAKPAPSVQRNIYGIILVAVESVMVVTEATSGVALEDSTAKLSFLRAGSPVPGLVYPIRHGARLGEEFEAFSEVRGGCGGPTQRGLWKSCTPLSWPTTLQLLQEPCSEGLDGHSQQVAEWLAFKGIDNIDTLFSVMVPLVVGELMAAGKLKFLTLPWPEKTQHIEYIAIDTVPTCP